MKQLFFLLAMFLSFSAYSQLSETENKALDELIASKVEIEANALKAGVVKNTFDAAFFKVKTIPHYNNNGGYREIVLVKKDGKMLEIMDAETLVPFIRSEFRLNSQAEASQLKDALNLLLDSATGSEDEIVQKGNQWILVCEEWFGEKNGFVVETDSNGKITTMNYVSDLEI